MGRKQLKSHKRDADVHNRTIRERHLARLFSLIYLLNDNQCRYSFNYNGYMLTLSKYNFSKKQFELVEEHNITQMDYDKSYKVIYQINKRLHKELISFGDSIDCDWEEDDE